jgi:membrane protein
VPWSSASRDLPKSEGTPAPHRVRLTIAVLRARVNKLVERAQRTLPVRVLTAYGESRASNYALALAFAGFVSMFPMILGALAIIGLAIRDPATEVRFQTFVINVFPASAQPELQRAIEGVKASAGWLGVVSVAGLLWSASSIFATMEFGLTEIFGTRQRNLLRQRLMGLVAMILLVVAIVATVGLNAIASFVPVASPFLSFLFGSAVMVSLLVTLYRFVPNRKFRIRDVIPGALIAGVFIEVLSFAFPIYARIAGGFNTYGAQFTLFFLLATWFYLLSQLILLGAVFNKVRLADSRVEATRASSAPLEADPRDLRAPEPSAGSRRSIMQRVALGAVVAFAVAAGFVRRRRPRSAG